MTRDYMPQTEEKFFGWQKNFTEQVTKNLAAWNIPPAAAEALSTAKAAYDPAYEVANLANKAIRTPQQTKRKNVATDDYRKAIRKFVKQWLAFNDAVSDDQRLALGITIVDVVRSATGVPATIPDVVVEPMPGSKLKVSYRQAPGADGTSRRGKPSDAAEIEIAAWIGPDAPASGESCFIKSRYSKGPVVLRFSGDDAGKTVYIFARWIGKGKQPGDWGNAVIEIISK